MQIPDPLTSMSQRRHTHAPLAGAGNLSKPVGRVGLSGPAAGLGETNVEIFGAVGLYGGAAETYGEPAEPTGICVGVWRLPEPWKRMGERRRYMGKAARMCGDCWHGGRRLRMGAARLYGELKSHESLEYEGRMRPADFVYFWQHRGDGT